MNCSGLSLIYLKKNALTETIVKGQDMCPDLFPYNVQADLLNLGLLLSDTHEVHIRRTQEERELSDTNEAHDGSTQRSTKVWVLSLK